MKGREDMKYFNKHFFSNKGATKFIESLKENGISDYDLTVNTDGFGQKIYIVEWNNF